MTGDRLGLRALNRATLDRQLLLRRAAIPARRAVQHLAGLQAQAPLAPYVGLWTRLASFHPKNLEDLYAERAVVRAHVMRNTVHLVTAADFIRFRPLFQPLIERATSGTLLVEGQWQGVWKITRAGDKAVLRVTPFVPLSTGDIDAIGIEGIGLLEFALPAAVALDVQFAPARSAQ